MKIRQIKFNEYRNIENRPLEIESDITCLVGVNEAGKSNILLGIEKCDASKSVTQEDYCRHSEGYLTQQVPKIEMLLVPSSSNETEELKDVFALREISEIRLSKIEDKITIDYPVPDYEKLKARRIEQALISSTESPEEATQGEPAQAETAPEEATQGEPAQAETAPEEATQGEPAQAETAPEEATQGEPAQADNLNIEQIRMEVTKRVIALIPKFRFFDSVDFDRYFLPKDGDIEISKLINSPNNYQAVHNLLKLAELNPSDLTSYSTPSEKNRRDTRLKRATEKINQELLRAFWPIDLVNISIGAEAGVLKIRIHEELPFLPGERSRGLQWALAFNIYFLASADSDLKNTVLLIDEPGIFLHIGAQHKMLESTFPKIVRRGNQIIYSTHLPYLIDKKYPERIRILEKIGESTKLGNKAWSEGEFGSIPEPVRTALGLNIEEAFLFGDKNLIVEGPSDQIYLQTMSKYLEGNPIEEITVVPAYGAEKVPKVIGLSLLSNKEAVGVIDSDKNIDEIAESLTKVGILNSLATSIF